MQKILEIAPFLTKRVFLLSLFKNIFKFLFVPPGEPVKVKMGDFQIWRPPGYKYWKSVFKWTKQENSLLV